MFSISTLVIDSMLNQITAAIDSGLLGGKLLIYSGVRPRPGDPVTNQILLVNCTFPLVSAPTSVESSLDFYAFVTTTVVGEGTATWCRATNSAGIFGFDADVGRTDSNSDVRINDTSVSLGNTVIISDVNIKVVQ